MGTYITVGYQQSCGDSGKRNEPFRVGKPEPHGTGPDLFLVLQKTSPQVTEPQRR